MAEEARPLAPEVREDLEQDLGALGSGGDSEPFVRTQMCKYRLSEVGSFPNVVVAVIDGLF